MGISDNEIDSALKLLDAEIMRMNADEKEGYQEAKESAPELITRESDPLYYLRSCKNDVPKAAKRLAFYWKLRKESFQEKAYRPLDLTGNGAMSVEDIELLRCGAYAVLPNGSIYINRWRLSESLYNNQQARLRVHFYVLSVAIAHLRKTGSKATAAAKGSNVESEQKLSENFLLNLKFVILINDPSATSSKNDHFDFYVPKKLNEFVVNALPAANVSVHLVSLPVEVDEQQSAAMSAYRSLVGKLASFLMVMVGTVLGRYTVHHRASNLEDLVQSLKQHGFSKRTLPVCMGGNWTDEHNKQFLQRQLRSEENRLLSEDEKLQRKRQVNRIHSRQKRARRRIEFEVLQEQHADLTSQNEKLRAENEKLEEILRDCTREVVMYEAGARGDQLDTVSSLASGFPLPRLDTLTMQALLLQEQRQQHQYDNLQSSLHYTDSKLPSTNMHVEGLADGSLPVDTLLASSTSSAHRVVNLLSLANRRVGIIGTNNNQDNSSNTNDVRHLAILNKLQQSHNDSSALGLLDMSSTLPRQHQQQQRLYEAQLLQQLLQQSQTSISEGNISEQNNRSYGHR
jgi:hypothetical protein